MILKALLLTHPFHMIRDTARYRPLQRKKGKPHSLKYLAKIHLQTDVQESEHSSVEDARAAMLIFLKHKKEWEFYMSRQKRRLKKGKKKQSVAAISIQNITIPESDSSESSNSSENE